MSDLEMTKITLKKFGIQYHEIIEGENVYIQTFGKLDVTGRLYVKGYGLVELKSSDQLNNYMEFNKETIASY